MDKCKDTLFENMKFNVDAPPILLHKLFSQFKNIEVTIENGDHHVSFNNLCIASIVDTYSERDTYKKYPTKVMLFTPGILIHRNANLFKTYNTLLRTFCTGIYLKFIANKWTVMEEGK